MPIDAVVTIAACEPRGSPSRVAAHQGEFTMTI